MAAKLVLNIRDYNASVTKAKIDLHWLSIEERIEFKIILLVFKCINNQAPAYLQKFIAKRNVQSNLRSTQAIVLDVPYVKNSTQAWRSFSVCGPRPWNNLPQDIRKITKLDNFKKNLKTHLFARYVNM